MLLRLTPKSAVQLGIYWLLAILLWPSLLRAGSDFEFHGAGFQYLNVATAESGFSDDNTYRVFLELATPLPNLLLGASSSPFKVEFVTQPANSRFTIEYQELLTLYGQYQFDLDMPIWPYLKAGLNNWKLENRVLNYEESHSSPVVGLGLRIDLGRTTGVKFELGKVYRVSDTDLSLSSLGFYYLF